MQDDFWAKEKSCESSHSPNGRYPDTFERQVLGSWRVDDSLQVAVRHSLGTVDSAMKVVKRKFPWHVGCKEGRS